MIETSTQEVLTNNSNKRKRCEHGYWRKSECRKCEGSSTCEHSSRKSRCKVCNGKAICEHSRIKTSCTLCKGVRICEHNKLRSRCVTCKGSGVCEHDRLRDTCKTCKGGSICEHSKVRTRCKVCKGGSICEHNRVRQTCIDCDGSNVCEHKTQRSTCKTCKGSSICSHGRRRTRCIVCKGGSICSHNKHKTLCKVCDGRYLCKSIHCEVVGRKKFEGYCMRCFIHLYPEQKLVKNYKVKEYAVLQYLKESFPEQSWVHNKRIEGGYSRRMPDILLDLVSMVLVIEVDENQHEDYDCSCENKRIMEISKDINHRPLVFIRFNPDSYVTNTNIKMKSPWSYTKQGLCKVSKGSQAVWTARLFSLKQQVAYWMVPDNKTEKTVEVINMYYDGSV